MGETPFFEELLLTATAVKEHRKPKEALKETLLSIEAKVELGRKELEQTATVELQEEMAFLESAFSKFRDGAGLIRQYLESENETQLEQGLVKIEPAFHEIREGLLRFGLKRAALLPSKDPALNLLINFGKGLQDGSCSPTLFEGTFSFYENHLGKIQRTLRRLEKMEQKDPKIKSILETSPLDLQNAEALLAQARYAYQNKHYDEMQNAFQELAMFSEKCYTLFKNVSKLFEQEEEKRCPRCSQLNAKSAGHCVACGFLFPEFGKVSGNVDFLESEGKQKWVITENIEKLLSAVEDFQDGEITQDKFLETLDWMEKKIEKATQHDHNLETMINSLPSDNPTVVQEAKNLFAPILEMYKEGTREMKEGLKTMHEWAFSKKEEDCQNGVKQFLEGASKLQDAVSRAERALIDFTIPKKKEQDQFAGEHS
jgi:tetratricopeptide (TPR) repeat protein